MRRNSIKRFIKDEGASGTVEFVAISGFFLVLAFIVMEIALATFWWQTAEVAAQIGARYAVVWDPAVTSTSLPTTNVLNGSGSYGQSCSISAGSTNDPCVQFSAVSCARGSGGSCNSTAFKAVVAKMQTVFGAVQASNVTITYSYAGLGFVGGPIVPAVTVQVSGVPFVSGFADLLAAFFGTSALTTVPTMSATFTGEDLSSAGA